MTTASADTISDGQRKATALLLAMGRPLAGRLVARLSPKELRDISEASRNLPPVDRTIMDALIEDFARQFVGHAGIVEPDAEIVRILEEALGEDGVRSILTPTTTTASPEADHWPSIAAAEPPRLAAQLAGEPAAAIHVVLAKLTPSAAGALLAVLSPDVRLAATRALLAERKPHPMATRALELALASKLSAVDPAEAGKARYRKLAALLNGLDKVEATALLDALQADDPEAARAIAAMMFDFSDLGQLDAKARVLVLDGIETAQLAVALAGMDAAFSALCLEVLGPRARRMAEAEIAQLGEPAPDAVKAARRAIADRALMLASEGRIVLGAAGDDADG